MFDNKNTHPSFGMLGLYRRHCGGGTPLFGSSIKHTDVIALVLKEGSYSRNYHEDWFFGGKQLFEVEMSGEQFANLLTNMNCGDGVPVTIRYTEKLGNLKWEDVPYEDKMDLHKKEFAESCKEKSKLARNLIDTVKEKFESKKLLKSDREEILSLLSRLETEIGSNVEFQMSQFNEQVKRTKTEAKAEIEMFWQNKLLQLANQTVVENKESLLEENKTNIVELE